MLTRPSIQDDCIITCIRSEYGLNAEKIIFLPLGADRSTAVFRVVTTDGTSYFLKLRSSDFYEACVAVPRYLSDRGIRQIIPPLRTRSHQLWAELESYKVMLYPFIEMCNGAERKLSPQQWVEFGTVIKKFHSTYIPSGVTRGVPREDYSPRWRDTVMLFLEQVKAGTFTEPVALEMAAYLKSKRTEVLKILKRAERLAKLLYKQPPKFILCHADMYIWNLLVEPTGALRIVDWDTLIFAPKERDLMFVGGGLGDSSYTAQEQEAHFYLGYGQVTIDPIALAYYRYERVIEDIATNCEQILSSTGGGGNRAQALEYLKSNFLPNGTIARAIEADQDN